MLVKDIKGKKDIKNAHKEPERTKTDAYINSIFGAIVPIIVESLRNSL